jgi:hypothetical protein
MYALAERLHVTLTVVEDMSLTEFNGWVAYFSLQEDKDG